MSTTAGKLPSKVEFVVRTVGERTTDVCVELVRRVGYEPRLIREDTHFGAIRDTFEYGLASDADWLFCVDADVILSPNAVRETLLELHDPAEDALVIHPGVADKLYRMQRWAGIRIYRREAFGELKRILKEKNRPGQLKIEGACVGELRKAGQPVAYRRRAIGLHDFDQYYGDLYRKIYLNTVRNPNMNSRAGRLWGKWRSRDKDYEVALLAMNDAEREHRSLSNSINDFDDAYLTRRLATLGLEEKPRLTWQAFVEVNVQSGVESEIQALGQGTVFRDFFETPSWQRKMAAAASRLKRILASH